MNAIEVRYRGMKIENNGSAPRLTFKAENEHKAGLRVMRATDRANNAGEPFFSYYGLKLTEVEPGLWEAKLFCYRDAINVRGEWFELDGKPVQVRA